MGHDDESGKLLMNAMVRLGLRNGGQCQDASSFDMLLSASSLYCDGWRRAYLALEGGAPAAFAEAQLVISVVMSRHIFHIGQDLHATGQLGSLGSGLFSTASSNSWIRAHLYSSAFWKEEGVLVKSLTMGDDLAGSRVARPEHYAHWLQMGMLLNDEDEDEIIPADTPWPEGCRDASALEEALSHTGDGCAFVDERAVVYFTSHRFDLLRGTFTFDNMEKLLLRLSFVGLSGLTTEQLAGVLFAVRNCREQVETVILLVRKLESHELIESGTIDAALAVPEEDVVLDGIL